MEQKKIMKYKVKLNIKLIFIADVMRYLWNLKFTSWFFYLAAAGCCWWYDSLLTRDVFFSRNSWKYSKISIGMKWISFYGWIIWSLTDLIIFLFFSVFFLGCYTKLKVMCKEMIQKKRKYLGNDRVYREYNRDIQICVHSLFLIILTNYLVL